MNDVIDINQKLLNLLKDNPNLPIMIFSENNPGLDYNLTATELSNCYVGELTLYNNEVWYEYDELFDCLSEEVFCDDAAFKNLNDDEYEKAIHKYIEENYTFEKYIIIVGRS